VSDESVKKFVRETLGCDCAEEVFSQIENEHGASAAGIELRNKLNIGNRLLVYIVEAGLKDLEALINAGKGDRDARGFNRFRLVLLSDDKKFRKTAFDAFKTLPAVDDKVYLHVIGKAVVSDL
jgi:hypothetical protein